MGRKSRKKKARLSIAPNGGAQQPRIPRNGPGKRRWPAVALAASTAIVVVFLSVSSMPEERVSIGASISVNELTAEVSPASYDRKTTELDPETDVLAYVGGKGESWQNKKMNDLSRGQEFLLDGKLCYFGALGALRMNPDVDPRKLHDADRYFDANDWRDPRSDDVVRFLDSDGSHLRHDLMKNLKAGDQFAFQGRIYVSSQDSINPLEVTIFDTGNTLVSDINKFERADIEATARERQPTHDQKATEIQVASNVDHSIDDEEITPATWRSLELEIRNYDGSVVEIGLLRPIWWLDKAGARVGETIALSIPEMGVEGDAEVLSIGPATVDSRKTSPGKRVVIGTFAHSNAIVLDLYFNSDSNDPLGVTPNHPLWSASRDGWIEAGELEIGEYVETKDGVAQLTSRRQRPGRHKVYNLEVHKDHNYYVSDLRILAHNSCVGDGHLRSPKTIKFSQSNISTRFSDGRSLNETVAMLRRNSESAAKIEPILITKFTDLPKPLQQTLLNQGADKFDVFAVTGNRRLAAARLAGSKINVRFATKKELDAIALERRFTTETAGRGLPEFR